MPVNREEDAELIGLIARILDATATDLIYLLYLDCFTERVEQHRCIVGSMCLRKRYREGQGSIETERGFFVISNSIAEWVVRQSKLDCEYIFPCTLFKHLKADLSFRKWRYDPHAISPSIYFLITKAASLTKNDIYIHYRKEDMSSHSTVVHNETQRLQQS